MISRVGNDLPTDAQFEAWADMLATLRAQMAPYIIKLSAKDKRHLATLRVGGEPIMALIATLSRKYNVSVPDMPIDGMENDLELSHRLVPLYSETQLLAGFYKDTIACAKSEAWQAAMGNYTILARVAETNPALHAELAPAREFMKRKSHEPAADETAGDGADASTTTSPTTGTKPTG